MKTLKIFGIMLSIFALCGSFFLLGYFKALKAQKFNYEYKFNVERDGSIEITDKYGNYGVTSIDSIGEYIILDNQ